MSTNFFSVAEALKSVSVSSSTLKVLTDDLEIWDVFGKKDSHKLRAKLFKLFSAAKLDNETIFTVYFFFATIKNRNRVLASFEELPDDIKSISSVKGAIKFISEVMVQYTSEETSKRFAAVHLPTTMPGLDLLATALITENTMDAYVNNIVNKQTFAQININSELQAINKAAQENFWNNIVKSSRNEARSSKRVTEDLKFNENYYKTSANDKYLLLDINMNEVVPADTALGYTKEEVTTWFQKIKDNLTTMTTKKASSKSPVK
jgi:hypothetical protein